MSRRQPPSLSFLVGAGGLACLGLLAAFVPPVVGAAGLRIDLAHDLASPAMVGGLGRGENGVDVLAALIFGARTSLGIAALATLLATAVALLVGAGSGFVGGRVEALLMRIVDVVLAFPGLLLALYLAAVLPPSIPTVVLALSATSWAAPARLLRGVTVEIAAREYVVAARALGAHPARILVVHILPALLPTAAVQASLQLSATVVAEASLSFLGLGLPPGTPSWGALLDQGMAVLLVAPHVALAAGSVLALTALLAQLLGDSLRDSLDVRARIGKE